MDHIKQVNKGLENKIIELQQKIEDMVRYNQNMLYFRIGFITPPLFVSNSRKNGHKNYTNSVRKMELPTSL